LLDIDLIRRELLGNTFVSNIYYFEEIGSTNKYAKTLSGEDNVLVISEFQGSGKGRFERVWESEKGSNLTFSIKKKFNISPAELPFINFFFSYFVYLAIKEHLEENDSSSQLLSIKWPNDILYDNKKISGLLVESNIEKNEFTIGIGINLNQQKFNPEYNAVSSVNIINRKTDISLFLIRLINIIDKNLSLMEPVNEILFTNWKNASNLIGRSVVFNVNDNMHKYGNVMDLQKDGGIKLFINGKEQIFFSGEIKITLIGN
jgi:BirA family biotin operon repressor/biotin-[acetyl-CoA-carboxylase] ligase